MANPEHLKQMLAGRHELARWREKHPDVILDCTGADLTAHSWDQYDLSRGDFSRARFGGRQVRYANLEGANLSGARLENADFTDTNLTGVNLQGANCTDATFINTNFTGARFKDAILQRANFQSARFRDTDLPRAILKGAAFNSVSLQGVDFGKCDLSETSFQNANLSGAKLFEAILKRATLNSADLSSAFLDGANLDGASLNSANLKGASLLGASMRGSILTSSDFTEAKLTKADFYEAVVDGANFDKATGLTLAKNLSSVRISDPRSDVRYFDSAIVTLPEKTIGWERIRWLGRLPLFAASYTALIAIPFLYYLLDIFNRRVDAVRAWATAVDRDGPYGVGAKVILDHLHREPIPSLSLLLLISTLLLGIGATIFAIACPARIREFNRDQWRDQLGHSLIHYLPLSWQHRWTRIICLLLYAVGGFGVAFVLASKLWNVLWFIVDNS